MLELDGSIGGGQILRSALSLSAITGTPFRMTAIRGSRRDSGLKPQHLAGVRAVERVCNGSVSDVDIGSEELTFRPGTVTDGHHVVDIGTAGSVTLLFDTVLPLVSILERPLTLTVRGGTDVRWSPPVAYYQHVKLPLCRRFGVRVALELDRTGFYPAGGGLATLWLSPSTLDPVEFTERGTRLAVRTYSKASVDLQQRAVAERQRDTVVDRFEATDDTVREHTVTYARTHSPGSALVIRADYEHSLAGFSALGERGRPAEDVAESAVDPATAFDRTPGAVDEHMADQLVLFLALAGGRVRISRLTDHVESSLELVSAFGFDVSADRATEGIVLSGRTNEPGR